MATREMEKSGERSRRDVLDTISRESVLLPAIVCHPHQAQIHTPGPGSPAAQPHKLAKQKSFIRQRMSRKNRWKMQNEVPTVVRTPDPAIGVCIAAIACYTT